jgi:hypothetical protein
MSGSGTLERAQKLVQAADASLDWVGRNAALVQEPQLQRDLKRLARRARRLRAAAERPNAVAVFGASQAGKSYLVSVLGAPPGKSLQAKFGDRTYDFLKEINPEGGNESTGVVTRLTLRPPPAPADAPVTLRLLSQTDVVKIVANSFFVDLDVGELAPPDPAAVKALLDRLEVEAGPAPVDGLTVDDVEEMQEYFDRYFRNNAHLTALGSAYWAGLAAVAPRLQAEKRAQAFAPLWGGISHFTSLVEKLLGALKSMGFADVVHCGMEALLPREQSIILVSTLDRIGSGAGPLAIRADGGRSVTVDRAVVTALIAELTLPLPERPWPFFDHTDLLDFPGARTRREAADPEKWLASSENLGFAFRRGKVEYLFQRYNAEQEITAMLLCVGDSAQEAGPLPKMVKDWIDVAIGAKPEIRQEARNSLFLVLTKFDMEFKPKAGEDVEAGTRWSNRITASLLDFFGKSHDWPERWTPQRPFDNTLWFRNPSMGFAEVMEYGGEPKRETGIAARAKPDVEARRSAYLANPLVQRHFADPAGAFDAALQPNDGGVTYLAGRLAPVCDPSLKASQVALRGREVAQGVAERLRPFFRGGNLEEELERARARGRALLRSLMPCVEAQMLGPLVRNLQPDADRLAGVYWRLSLGGAGSAAAGPAPIGRRSTGSDYADMLGDLLGQEPADAKPGRAAARDLHDRFAEAAVAEWNASMRRFAEDAAAVARLQLDPETVGAVVTELYATAKRLALQEQLAAALRARAAFRGGTTPGKMVSIAEQVLGGFVHSLGLDAVPPERRPKRNGGEPLFAPRPRAPGGTPALPEVPDAPERHFGADWLRGFFATIEENVRDATGAGFDLDANRELGVILAALEQAA